MCCYIMLISILIVTFLAVSVLAKQQVQPTDLCSKDAAIYGVYPKQLDLNRNKVMIKHGVV